MERRIGCDVPRLSHQLVTLSAEHTNKEGELFSPGQEGPMNAMTDKDEARQTILQRTTTIRPKGYTDERWLADVADAHRRGYGLKWEEREIKFLREISAAARKS
jgi:hypothetical protein